MLTQTACPELVEGRSQRVSFVSLGCAKNLVDSEVMIGKLGGQHLRFHRSGQG